MSEHRAWFISVHWYINLSEISENVYLAGILEACLQSDQRVNNHQDGKNLPRKAAVQNTFIVSVDNTATRHDGPEKNITQLW